MSDQHWQRGEQQVRPSWTTQLRAILSKTMRAKSRQRLSMLGEIFMPVQMIAWIFLMKMNLPDFRYPAVEFSAFNATEYSPFLCTFSSRDDPQECLSQDHYGPASRSIFIGFAPDSPSVQGIMEVVNASMLASGYPIQVQMFASKGDLTQAINEADECQSRSQWDPAAATCVGLEIVGSASNVEYTMYTLEGALPNLNADLPGTSACRPYWKSLSPPIMYPGADNDGPWGQSFLPSECDVNKYMTSRFLDVQLAVNHAIAAASGATQTASLELRLEALPRQAVADTFASSTSFFRVLLSYYVVLGMGQSLQVMVTTLVKEKEKHLREGLVSMGLRNSVYWLAHAITYLIVQFIICWGIVAMLFVVGMAKSSSPLLLFVLVYSFAITLIVLSFAVSTIYSKARSAGANAMFAVMILTTPFMALQYVELSSGQLLSLALLSPLAFCVGLDTTWAFEGGYASVEGLSFTSISVAGPLGLSVAQCLIMIWVDVFLYTLLLLYLERVVPQGLWSPQALWFPCNPRFWRQGCCSAPTHSARVSVGPAMIPADDCAREQMVPDTGSVEAVRLNKVTKVFPAKCCSGLFGCTSQNDVRAVDNVSLTLHSGQIFGLLGHNGAGKTTLLRIMSGLHTPTSGTAYVNGLDVTTSINEVRQSLGVCPQHDLLFENLTVMEHIQLYASLKGVQRADVEDAGMAWLARVGLTEKAQSMATTLSGGQKRRLSVAMSLIGDPNVIYLDEPTTGLDPAARRSLWKILKDSREGRLILLSTHFMDEADILADQKAIIAHGRLQCLGSSLWLKVHFGLGYGLELTKADPQAPVQPVEALVRSHVPDAVLQQDSSDGAVFKLPVDAVKSFGALLTDLDSNMGHFKLESYGVTMGTLEEIFMRFADGGDLADNKPSDKRSNKATIDSTLDVLADKQGSGPDMQVAILDEDAKQFSWARVGAMMRARMVFTWKNKESSGITLFTPILLAAIMVNLPDPNTTSSEPTPTVQSLVTSLLGGTAATELLISLSPDVDAPFGQVQSWLAEETQLQVLCWDDFTTDPECKGGSLDIAPAFAANAQMRQELRGILVLNEVNLDADPSGGWDVTLMYNTGAEAAVLMVYASLLGNAVLRNVTTQVPDGPYGLSASMEEIQVETNVPFSFSAMPIMICFVLAFPPVALCAMLVRDNELKTRFQLSVMGLSSIEYWTSTYLQNLVLLCVPYGVCYILMIASGVEPISGQGAGPYAVLMVEFMLAITLYVYLFSHLFTSHEKVFQILPSVLQLPAMLCQMTVLILLLMDPDSDLPLTMHKLFSWLLPQYGICGALVYMQYQMVEDRMLAQMTNSTAPSYFSNDGVQVTMVAYAVQIPVFFFMLIMIDRLKHKSKEFVDTGGADDGGEVDEDVVAEQRTVDTATPDSLAIRARKLRKVFPPADAGCAKPDEKSKETVAVRGLSIGVRPNECLGLLGPNGAGKTTTFRMMTADESPSSGEIHVSGYSAATEAYKVWRSLGFCPQHDALWPELSARHHLDLYARLKGKRNPDEAVSSMLEKLDLVEHADKMTSEMSGGNRRKLSAAIALVAAPKVSFLDEPSSGMDVATRVHMWEMVKQSLSTGAVVLTTHSMEEAETLSTRIAIMTKGKLRCIGTLAHLKHRFGRGYRVELKVGGSEPVQDGSQLSRSNRLMEEAGQFVEQELGGTVLESFGTRLTAAACSEQSPAAIFRLLEKRCEALSISDYSVSQPTMEQIFLDFALHEGESEGEEE